MLDNNGKSSWLDQVMIGSFNLLEAYSWLETQNVKKKKELGKELLGQSTDSAQSWENMHKCNWSVSEAVKSQAVL